MSKFGFKIIFKYEKIRIFTKLINLKFLGYFGLPNSWSDAPIPMERWFWIWSIITISKMTMAIFLLRWKNLTMILVVENSSKRPNFIEIKLKPQNLSFFLYLVGKKACIGFINELYVLLKKNCIIPIKTFLN